MTSDLGWRFDPIPASGAITGGAAETFVFKPQLASFVREVLQNSHDQRLGQSPVRVDFRFHEYSPDTADREALEQALGWEQLRTHLAAVAEGESTMSLRIAQALDALEAGPLLALEITDRNTAGLNGDEFERGANFAALCRNVLDTPPGTKPGRGGSYGLGKAVLWLYSSLSTIMFSSRLSADGLEGRSRFIGRAVLPYHEVSPHRLSGLGWFGDHDADTEGRERSVSVWDDAALQIEQRLGIDRDDASGTSILVLGFREPYLDETRPAEEIAKDVLRHASLWFWPAMTASPVPTLQVSSSVVRDGALVFEDDAVSTEEVSHFVTARSAADAQATAPTAGDVAERILDFRVPALLNPKDDQPQGEVTANFRLRVVRSEDAEHPHANSVALTRGAGMVVDYKDWGRKPGDGRPYFALLEAGLARGNSESDLAAESFLRAAEPPAHDDWQLTDAVRARYRQGGRQRLIDLQTAVRKALADICEENLPSSQQGPALLAKLLPMGRKTGKAKPPGPQFHVDFHDPTFENGAWTVKGRVVRHRGAGDWHATVVLALDAESGRAEAMELAHCQAQHNGDALRVEERQESAVIWVDATIDEFAFEAAAVNLPGEDAYRTRLLADVRPRLGGEGSA